MAHRVATSLFRGDGPAVTVSVLQPSSTAAALSQAQRFEADSQRVGGDDSSLTLHVFEKPFVLVRAWHEMLSILGRPKGRKVHVGRGNSLK